MGDCCSTYEGDAMSGKGSKDAEETYPSTTRPTGNTVGSKVYIYKQDPVLHYVGHRVVWLPVEIRSGPVTDDVLILGMSKTFHDTDGHGNFLYNPRLDPDGFDAVNTLTIIEQVLWMYRRVLRKTKQRTLNWLWGNRPIQAFPHAGRDSNAYYSRGEKALKFFYFSDGVKTIYACRSWDIVAHEAGHAILDSLQPGWITSTNPQTGALHEAFGDITSIFSVLDQLDMCELIVAHTKGNLAKRDNCLAALGEEFGRGIGRYFGLRNADEDLKISQSTTEVHELSKVFTGAVYDVLVRIFVATLHLTHHHPAETLYRAGRHLLSVFLLAIIEGPYKDATFEDIANLMIKKEPQEEFKKYMKEEFTRREVFDEWARPMPHRTSTLADRTVHACATLKACGMKLPGMEEEKALTEKSAAGSNKSSISRRNIQRNNIHVDSPASNKGSHGHHSHSLQTNHVHYENTSGQRASLDPRVLQHNAEYQNNTSSFKSNRNMQQNNYQENTSSFKSPPSKRSVQQINNYQDNANNFKGSIGARNKQQNNNHHENTSSFKGSSLPSRNIQPNSYHDNIGSYKGSLTYRNVQQVNLQQTHTYQNVPNRSQHLTMDNANLDFPPPPPSDELVWEDQSANYSDNVFDSTEI